MIKHIVIWKLKEQAHGNTREALDAYQIHPEHKKIMPFILEARDERRIVDYEI